VINRVRAQEDSGDTSLISNTKIDSKAKGIKYGIASFYTGKFNGRQTANGEIYNDGKYTAACNVFPLNTWIKVTNLRNNKSVVVIVNDRMHPKNMRLVDLSKISAKELGYTGRGLTRVKIEIIKHRQLKSHLHGPLNICLW
jgi:rare lipoprotein A